MCGIGGIISENSSRINREALIRMGNAVGHRGPDGEGNWISPQGNCGVTHRRLAVIDLSEKGNQPMHYQNKFTIVYNGEIYNYKELKSDLIKRGFGFVSDSDTEVILALYSCFQEKCVDYLDGMFSFAIWDEHAQVLFAARDRFGEKPFFYFFDPFHKTFIFSSEIKGLRVAGVPGDLNENMMLNYVTLGFTQNPQDAALTFFSAIKKLPAASLLVFDAKKNLLDIRTYWKIDPQNMNHKISFEESQRNFSFLLKESIRKRLRSDVSIGTSLSGGLDSSSIVSLMVHSNGLKPNTFSAVFPHFEKDESHYIKSVSNRLGLSNFTVSPTAEDLANDFEKICYYQEEPWESASCMAQFRVYALAWEHGFKVLLDGQGADETLGGYKKYFHWYWQELLKTKGFKYASEEKSKLLDEKWGTQASIKNYLSAYLPGITSKVLSARVASQQKKHPYLNTDFFHNHYDPTFLFKPRIKALNDILYFDTFQMGLEKLLRYADRNSMAHGVEVRLPFLNHTLVEFIFSLPAEFKIKNGFTKYLLRSTVQDLLPTEIVWRKDKVGFETPQKIWMENIKVKEMIQEARKKLVQHQILNKEILSSPIIASSNFEKDNNDWRYLTAAYIL